MLAHQRIDPHAHSVALLGRVPAAAEAEDAIQHNAIVRIEKTALPVFSDELVARTQTIEATDIVRALLPPPRAEVNRPHSIHGYLAGCSRQMLIPT